MLKKLIIGLIILVACIGVVCAVPSITAPDGYTAAGDGFVSTSDSDVAVVISSWNDTNLLYENRTDYGISEIEDNIYLFVDKTNNNSGVREAVEIDGDNYTISIIGTNWVIDHNDDNDMSKAKELYDDLKEFNKENDFEPLEI